MLYRMRLVSLALSIFWIPVFSIAESQGPQLHPYQGLWFFSAQSTHAGHPRLFYQVCNRSGENSAFRWYGAGFAVTAFAELQTDWCAYKNTYTTQPASPKPHQVKIQGKQTGSVLTWSPDNNNRPIRSIYSYIETNINGPEGFVENSIISIEVEIYDDGSGTLIISSSGAFGEVVIAFPSSSIDPSVIIDLQEGKVETSSSRASEFSPGESEFVIDNPETLALIVRPTEDRNFTASFKIGDLGQLGGFVHIYGRVADGIAVLNEVPMPIPPG